MLFREIIEANKKQTNYLLELQKEIEGQIKSIVGVNVRTSADVNIELKSLLEDKEETRQMIKKNKSDLTWLLRMAKKHQIKK